MRWNSEEVEIHTLVIKTSMEEITYNGLVDKICKKLMVDGAMTQLRLSYFPLILDPKKPSYVRNDEDVFGYLMQVNNNQCRRVLHVELITDVEQNEGFVQPSEPQHGDDVNDGMDTFYKGEPSEPQKEDVVSEDAEDGEDGEDVGNNVHEDFGMYDDIEVAPAVEGDVYVNHTWEDGIDLVVGQEFGKKESLQELVFVASRKNGFEFDIIQSDTRRYVLKCRGAKDGCKWYLRAAKTKNSDLFSVRTYIKIHTCSRATTVTSKNRRKGTPQLVRSICHSDYPGKLKTPAPQELIGLVQNAFGVKVSYSTAWRGKRAAANDVRGSPEESYQLLHSYLYMLEYMNPGTRTYVELDEGNRFKYLFFALGACLEGFQVMRKVIAVDATHLKNAYGGVLIVATAQDPDHHHHPIAFGVVDGEKEASWMWFMSKLRSVVPDVPELVFLSDRNVSLLKSIREVFPLSQNGVCIYHLSQNVKENVSGVNRATCAKKFRACAHAYTENEFLTLYSAFRKMYPDAADYLDRTVGEEKWARCYFPGDRYNIDTTNCAESINGVFVEARKYSLLPMIDVIIAKLAEWFNKYRKASNEVSTAHKLVPYVENEMHVRCVEAKTLTVHELNSYHLEYNVIGRDGKDNLSSPP
ncbi:protein FAR1-RELATED SEQUENCE 3-like [Eutrema salsugineum]|uniref:protein FAR1-RELATED SEQUENCE 3-like n=1 Tax=Eutrema salsugineum TaxID=72664 RepID=UPI000CED6215|nr:protein FAR1-RELATED SEQUENCE 3-like [Eutrema salsugineum]